VSVALDLLPPPQKLPSCTFLYSIYMPKLAAAILPITIIPQLLEFLARVAILWAKILPYRD
jgi:hypothetical protein